MIRSSTSTQGKATVREKLRNFQIIRDFSSIYVKIHGKQHTRPFHFIFTLVLPVSRNDGFYLR